jgi:hypothetical protein
MNWTSLLVEQRHLPASWSIYFRVEDTDAALAEIVDLGDRRMNRTFCDGEHTQIRLT